jgi:hypothetical protein
MKKRSLIFIYPDRLVFQIIFLSNVEEFMIREKSGGKITYSGQLICFGLLLVIPTLLYAQSGLNIRKDGTIYKVNIEDEFLHLISSPSEGLWSIATEWVNDWPDAWYHSSPEKMQKTGEWTILSGHLELPDGKWFLQDAYRAEYGMIKCVRRFEWQGQEAIKNITLSVRWEVHGKQLKPFLPGILYYGNPSGGKNWPDRVPFYNGNAGEAAIFEEHRFPMPFACLESGQGDNKFGAAIYSIPSPVKNRDLADHWWSMGLMAQEGLTEFNLLSGPVAYNGEKSVSKGLQTKPLKYGNTFITVEPGTVIEKTFYLDVYNLTAEGTAFQRPVHQSLEIFKPYYADDLPTFNEIIQSKFLFARSRWIEGKEYGGFNMYPDIHIPEIVMGWAGQAASCGYAMQVLQKHIKDPEIQKMVQQSLDFLSTSPVSKDGFPVRFNVLTKEWYDPDHVSMGQSMYNLDNAIQVE